MPPRRRDVAVLQDLGDDVDGQFLLVMGNGGPSAAVGVRGDAGGLAFAGALGFTDADTRFDSVPFGDLADRLRGGSSPVTPISSESSGGALRGGRRR